MKRPKLEVLPYRHSKTHRYYLDLRAFNQGRKFFKTKAEAEAQRLRQLTTLQRHGREAIGLPQRELSDFVTAKKRLAEYGKTVGDAADFYLDHLVRVKRCKITVTQLVAAVLESKKVDGVSEVYLSDLRSRLNVFSRNFGNEPVASVTKVALRKWLTDLPGSRQTRINFRTNIGVLFGYAVDQGIIDLSPTHKLKLPRRIDKAPEIFTVEELQKLLEAAARVAPDVLPMIAIGSFAGIRDAEIKRLDWSEVSALRGFIEVKSEKAKTAKRRIVPIQPNLAQWLAPYSQQTGAVVPVNARKKLAAARKAAELERWPQNGLRHSFASYRYAATNDATRTAAELGHSNTEMLFNTYRQLVMPEEATKYWNISPQIAKNILPMVATQ